MKFAVYVRKSVYSDRSDSVSNQEHMCREYVEVRYRNEMESFETYSDEGFTGANTDRPGLKRLLEDAECGLIDALIVYQLDRLSRDVRDFANIYAALEEKSIMFISIKENIDTSTPIGKAMMYVTMVFAQMERETIAARVTDNMIGLAKKGFWTGGNPPYGYVRERIEVRGKKHVTISIDPEGAEYVQWIYNTFLENSYSLQRMETAFKNQGIRTVNGAFFSATQLYKILTMPYCVEDTPEVYDYYDNLGCIMDPDSPREKWDGQHGVMVYGRSTEKAKKHSLQPPEKWTVCIGLHKPFISAEKWLAVQQRFKKNIFDKTMKYDIPLLKGVLRCAKCGCLMQVSRKKIKSGILSHYYCLTRMRKGIEACDMKFIKCDILDARAVEIFREIEADPSVIFKYAGTSPAQNSCISIRDLESKADKIRKKIERLARTLSEAEGSTAAKYIIAQIEQEDLSLEAVKKEIETAKAETRRFHGAKKSAETRAREIGHLIRGLDGFSASEKNSIVRDAVKECTWDGETLFFRM